MEPARGDAGERARRSVRDLVRARADALKQARPNIVLGLLVGSALAPIASTLGPGGPAVAAALAQVIGGVGGSLLSNLVADAIAQAQPGKDDEDATAQDIATRVTDALDGGGDVTRQLSAESIDVLVRLGCLQDALKASDQGLRQHVSDSLRQLAEGDRQIRDALRQLKWGQDQQSDLLEEVADRLRWQPPPDPAPAPLEVVRVPVPVPEPRPGPQPAETPLARRWRAGEEGWAGDWRFLLLANGGLLDDGRDAAGEQLRQQAVARQTIPAPPAGRRYAWLRQAGHDLTRERDLLARVREAAGDAARQPRPRGAGRSGRTSPALAGLPEFRHYAAAGSVVTLALSWPSEKNGDPGRTARAWFTPGGLDRWGMPLLLAGLCSLSLTLDQLHRRGLSHRALTPDAIVVTAGDHFALRDLGLAATAFRPGEGPAGYQAPEQVRGLRGGTPGSATDVYQLAAVAYQLITGRGPAGTGDPPPPLHPDLPETAADLIAAALAVSPASRPGLRQLRAALRPPRGAADKPPG